MSQTMEQPAFIVIEYLLNIISSLSGIIVVIIYLYIKEIHSFPAELTMYLISSVCLYNITYFFPVFQYKYALCQAQGVLSILFDLSSLIWIAILGSMTYFSVINPNIQKNKFKLRIIFITVSIVPPLAFALIAFFSGKIQYSPHDDYCWLNFLEKNTLPIGIVYYCIVWFIIFFNLYFITAVILKIKSFKLEKKKNLMYTLKLIRYPTIQLISYTPNTIIGLIGMISMDLVSIPVWLLYIELILESLCGFFYVVAFVSNKEVLNAIKKSICKMKLPEESHATNFELKKNDEEIESIIDPYDEDSH